MPPERREQLARDGEDSLEVQLRSLGAKAQLTKWLLYALVLWLLKSSLLHFFAVRLTVCFATLSLLRAFDFSSGCLTRR